MNPDTKLILNKLSKKFDDHDAKWEQRFNDYDDKWGHKFADLHDARMSALERAAKTFDSWRPYIETTVSKLAKCWYFLMVTDKPQAYRYRCSFHLAVI